MGRYADLTTVQVSGLLPDFKFYSRFYTLGLIKLRFQEKGTVICP